MANEPERLVDLLHFPLEDATSGRLIVFNAPARYRLPAGFTGEAIVTQSFRPHFLALKTAGLPVFPQAQGEGFDIALVALGRHRGENERMLSDAAVRLKDGGLLVAAGFKSDGAASLRKRLADPIPGLEHASKHHGVVFWLRTDPAARRILEDSSDARALHGTTGAPRTPQTATPEGFVTAPGMFSHDRVDPASRLLVEALPADLKGQIADFGAGWGYLAVSMAKRLEGAVTRIDLYEADFSALEAARANMASGAPALPAAFHWHDVRREPIEARYDAIVMNPPFHEGRAAEPEIGRDFIRAAFAALKPRGRLFLVANRGMPYEAELAAFAASGELARDERYKVLWARR